LEWLFLDINLSYIEKNEEKKALLEKFLSTPFTTVLGGVGGGYFVRYRDYTKIRIPKNLNNKTI